MYSLLVRENLLDPLKETLEKHVQNMGTRSVHETAQEAVQVRNFLPFLTT